MSQVQASAKTEREISKVQVYVPEQSLSKVREAFATAKSLAKSPNEKLSTFMEVSITLPVLEKATKEGFILAVDPKDMPKEAGWYFVDREKPLTDPSISLFRLIEERIADKLIRAGLRYEVLRVNKSAIDAAKVGRPVALDLNYYDRERGYLNAYDWPESDARAALSIQAKDEQQTRLLRTNSNRGTLIVIVDENEFFRVELPPNATAWIKQ